MSNITLTIPNDDHIALRAFGKALEEMALAHGAPLQLKINEEALSKALGELQQAAPCMMQEFRCEADELQGSEIDTTAQQVESLAVPGAKHIITEQKLVGDPVPVDGGFSQGYVATVEEISNPVDSTGTPWDERIHSASKALNADGTWRLRRKPKDIDEAEWAAFVEVVKAELMWKKCDPEVLEQMTDAEMDTSGEPTSEEIDEWEKSKQPDYLPEPPVTPPGDDFHTVVGIPPLPVPPPTEWQSEVTHPETGDLCSVCMKPQFSSPSGVTCENGHGGAPAYEKPVPPPVVVAPPVPEVTTWDFPRLMTFLTERHGKIDVATVNTLLAQDGMLSVQELNAHPDKIGPFVVRVKAHLGE